MVLKSGMLCRYCGKEMKGFECSCQGQKRTKDLWDSVKRKKKSKEIEKWKKKHKKLLRRRN